MAPEDNSPLLGKVDTKRIQEISGCLLWYARIVDNTLLKALNTIARMQSAPTELTKHWANQILDYCATNPEAEIQYQASDMQLQIDSDAAYLVSKNARSRAGEYYFLGDYDGKLFNGPIYILAKIIKAVMPSAAEIECGSLYINA